MTGERRQRMGRGIDGGSLVSGMDAKQSGDERLRELVGSGEQVACYE